MPTGYSASRPAGKWTNLGQMGVRDCLKACSQGEDLFMMAQTVDGVTSCWSAPFVDMSLLSQKYPRASDEYQVFEISALRIGTTFTVRHGSGLAVESTDIQHGYHTYDAKLPGEINILLFMKCLFLLNSL